MKHYQACAICLILCVFPASSEAACLNLSDPSKLVFSGLLTQNVFPGPPNYESIEMGDSPSTAFLLDLPDPVCVSGDEFISPDEQVATIHVFSGDAKVNEALARLADENVVVVAADAFGSHTGHHRARLVVDIQSVRAATESK